MAIVEWLNLSMFHQKVSLRYLFSHPHFDLNPVVRLLADYARFCVAWIEGSGDRVGESASEWMLLTLGHALRNRLPATASCWSNDND